MTSALAHSPSANAPAHLAPTTLAADLERGDHWIRETLSYWVARSQRTTRQMAAIASWGMGERSPLSHSILSRIINRKIGVSVPVLVSMEAMNRAIWLWSAKGREAAWAELGPHSAWDIRDEWLDESIWLPVPDDEQHPLELGDFVEVLVGRLELPYLGNRLLPPGDHRRLVKSLSPLLDLTIAASGLSPMEGVRRLLAAYPAGDEHRRERFRGVILGETQLTREELQAELLAIAEAVRVLRGLSLGSYGAAELLAELLAMAQQE